MVRWQLYIFSTLAALAVAQENWSFKRPEEWVNDYPDCGGSQQSPIPINPDEATKLSPKDLKNHGISYRLENLDTVVDACISNTGHFVMINVSTSDNATAPQLVIEDSEGESAYVLVSIVFHWKSPHPIDGRRHALEMHLEFRDSNNNGIILAYLFDVCSDTPKGMHMVGKFLDKLVKSGSSAELPSFPPADLLPKREGERDEESRNLCNFVKYMGSSCLPPCTEGVMFIVTLDISCVPDSHMELFNNIKDINGDPMEGYRPPQPLNGREVEYITC